MEYLMQILSVLGAWSAISVILGIAWARFHAAMGPRPRPRPSDREQDHAA